MGPRFAIAAGLLAGVGVAAILLLGLLVLAPEPASRPTPAPSVAQASSSGTPSSGPSATASPTGPATASAGVPSGAGFHVGEPAPALVVPQVGGGTIDLASLNGKPVWVNFMATWCPPCQDEFPLMNSFAARYASRGSWSSRSTSARTRGRWRGSHSG